MFRIIVYAILFILGYRVLKRFFAPDFGEVSQGREDEMPGNSYASKSQYPTEKSDVVEDIDFEEIDE